MTTVVLTRPKGKNTALASALQAKGLGTIELPALSIQPTLTSLSPEYLPDSFDLLVFVSAQAASLYLRLLANKGLSLPKGQCIATVGAASAKPFYDAGLETNLELIHPPADHPYQDSEALWLLLQPRLCRFERVLLVRGQQGREWLGQQLIDAQKTLIRCSIYERVPAQWAEVDTQELTVALQQPSDVITLLTSSESTQVIYTNMVRLGLEEKWLQSSFVAIHPRIAQSLENLTSLSCAQASRQMTLCAPSQPAMLDALLSAAMPK